MSDPSSAPTERRGGRITSYQAYGQRPSCLPAPAPPHSAPPPRPAQVIYACNVLDTDLESGNDMVKQVAQVAAAEGASHVVVSAQVRTHTWRMRLSPAPSPPPVALLALPVSASGTTRASFAAWRRTPPRCLFFIFWASKLRQRVHHMRCLVALLPFSARLLLFKQRRSWLISSL